MNNPNRPLSTLCDGLAGRPPASAPVPAPSGSPPTITYDHWDGSRWRHYRGTIVPGTYTLTDVVETDEIGIDLQEKNA